MLRMRLRIGQMDGALSQLPELELPCGRSNSAAEQSQHARFFFFSSGAQAVRLKNVETAEISRMACGIPELERVLGGGIVPASDTLRGRSGHRQIHAAPANGP